MILQPAAVDLVGGDGQDLTDADFIVMGQVVFDGRLSPQEKAQAELGQVLLRQVFL